MLGLPEAFLSALIFFSFSMRTPNEKGAPFDWEVVAGAQGDHFLAEYLTERQDGTNEYGLKLKKDWEMLWARWEVEDFKRTSRNIDSQKITVGVPRDFWVRVGVVSAYERWVDEERRLALTADRWGFTARAETHFEGLDAAEITYRRVAWASKGGRIQVEPVATYKFERDREYWEAKIRVNLLPFGEDE